jgi:hypothetical protein
MKMPFTIDQFLEVFRQYNLAIWPAQIPAYLLGFLAVWLAFRKGTPSNRIASGILSLFWIWNGAAYHLVFFSRINPAAFLFGGLYFLQGVLFFYSGVIKSRLSFEFRKDLSSFVGALIILYGLVIYNLIGPLFGHSYPYAPLFGVAPCPTTIFTLGLFLWADGKFPRYLFIIPGVWAIIGTFAAASFGIREDLGLIPAAILSLSCSMLGKKSGTLFTSDPSPSSAL